MPHRNITETSKGRESTKKKKKKKQQQQKETYTDKDEL